jgi:hypothetical protein
MGKKYTIFIKDPKTGKSKKISFGKGKQDEEVYENVNEDITIPVKIGDTILMGKFRNKKVVVKTIEKDEHGMPIINGKKVVNFRKLKEGIEVTFDGEQESYAPEFQPIKVEPKVKTDKKERPAKKISGKDVGELLNEIINPDTINVEQLNIKNNLCPKIWDSEDKMNPEVRQALLKNAFEFIKFASLENATFKDIILTGSLANYNWHEGSDLDIHILMDFDQISDDNEFVGDYFKTKKSLWGDRMPVTVKDHDVEVYVQDINEPHTSTGIYSIINDSWLTKPIKSMVALDIPNIQHKAIDYMNIIDDLGTSENIVTSVDKIDRVMDKLKAYRKIGLDDEGEFSTENLVFKVLRNTGYLEKLADLKEAILTKSLTLENVSMYTGGGSTEFVNENSIRDTIKNAINKGTLGVGIVVALIAAGITSEEIINDFKIPIELIQKAKEFVNYDVEDFNPDITNNVKINPEI